MVIKTASPGIIVREVDLTRGTADAITTNVAALVGPFQKGPVDEFTLIETEAELQRVFGDPTDYNYQYWYTASNFLEYGGVILINRVDDASGGNQQMRNATSGVTDPQDAPYIKNEDDFEDNFLLSAEVPGSFVARNPGTWANGLGVAVIDAGADYYSVLSNSASNILVKNPGAGTPDATNTTRFTKTLNSGSTVGKYVEVAAGGTTFSVRDYVFLSTSVSNIAAGTAAGFITAVENGIYTICVTTTANMVKDPSADQFLVKTGSPNTGTDAVTGVEAVGKFELYSVEAGRDDVINVIFIPEEITAAVGHDVYAWPASPRTGARKQTSLGQYYQWDENFLVWKNTFKPVDEVTFFYDATYVFQLVLAESWYDQQIAFAGIPWSRFASRPGTTLNAATRGAKNDEMNMIVYDNDGILTGSKGNTLLQLPGVSKLRGALTLEGANNFYVDQVNNFANFIFAVENPLITAIGEVRLADSTADPKVAIDPQTTQTPDPPYPNINFGLEDIGTAVADGVVAQYLDIKSYILGGGSDQLVATLGERQIGYDKLTTEEITVLDYVLQGPSEGNLANSISLANFIISVVEERRDCIAFISPMMSDVVGQKDTERITKSLVNFYNNLTSTSYAVFDSGYKYQYDRWNDVYRYIPLNADVAGCLVRSSILAEPWFSPAGLTRGQILNVTNLPYNPSKKQRDLLYPARINPIVTFPGEGTVLFGDKTALAYTSAFDRINVRKLFLICEKQIAKLSRVFLFEFNDEITRTLFKNNVNPFLRDVQSKRGIFDFLVVCDETNNTPEVIDRNEFIADIYIKPARSINFITLNFIATKTGVSFDESIALFRRSGGSV
jgi:hypothetical protein